MKIKESLVLKILRISFLCLFLGKIYDMIETLLDWGICFLNGMLGSLGQ